MTLRQQLIDAGLWDADDLRDPSAVSNDDAYLDFVGTLHKHGYTEMSTGTIDGITWTARLEGRKERVYGQGRTSEEAVCHAALQGGPLR